MTGEAQKPTTDTYRKRFDDIFRSKPMVESTADIEDMIAQRAAARKDGNAALAHQIERDLAGIGIKVVDTPYGTNWSEL